MCGLAAISAYHRLNGEIYNYRELRERGQTRGHQFCSDSDTGILLYARRELTVLFIKNEW
ncbi:MAG: hypothetical protein Q7T96_19190 [Methylobacter sp.]|nr:hypothetical protein [Methylobacter sp.]